MSLSVVYGRGVFVAYHDDIASVNKCALALAAWFWEEVTIAVELLSTIAIWQTGRAAEIRTARICQS